MFDNDSVSVALVNPEPPASYPRVSDVETGVAMSFPPSLLTDVSAPSTMEPAKDEATAAASVQEAPCYVDHCRANRALALQRLQELLDDLPPVSSVAREYGETRADLICAINFLKARE
jgi:hypothetical protein